MKRGVLNVMDVGLVSARDDKIGKCRKLFWRAGAQDEKRYWSYWGWSLKWWTLGMTRI